MFVIVLASWLRVRLMFKIIPVNRELEGWKSEEEGRSGWVSLKRIGM
jgi:hypothetical protein